MNICKWIQWLPVSICCLAVGLTPTENLADDGLQQKLLPPLEELPRKTTAADVAKKVEAVRAPAAQVKAKNDNKDPFQEKYEEALRRLTRAQIALRKAKTDAEREAAEKADREAKRILTAISKQRNAAIRRMAFKARGLRYAAVIREQVDPHDGRERFLLMAPKGPIIVEVDFLIDDAPYRQKREAFIDQRLAAVDSDNDGIVPWTDALKHPGFTLNRVRIYNEQQRKNYLDMFDVDRDGLVSRFEARAFVAQVFQGAAFGISGNNSYRLHGSTTHYMRNVLPPVNLWALLDVDGDERLSAQEILDSASRLKSRDQDDNDLLYPGEITGSVVSNSSVRRPVTLSQPLPSLAFLLGPTAAGDQIVDQLEKRYQPQGKKDPAAKKNDLAIGEAALLSDLMADKDFWLHKLDIDQDGVLNAAEAQQMNVHPAHLRATMRLGATKAARVQVHFVDDLLEEVSRSHDAVTLKWDNVQFAFNVSGNQQPNYNYATIASSYLARMDKNKDGYLSKKEFTPQTAANFELWDQDNDGKVYAKEIQQVYEVTTSPQWGRVTATVSPEGSALFRAIDVNGDLRIGAREMAMSPERLVALDSDNDDALVRDELPGTMTIRIALGGDQVVRGMARQPVQTAKAPDWFVRMDRNGDGDVTLKEFLGSPEAFKKLDVNQDGFIAPDEAH